MGSRVAALLLLLLCTGALAQEPTSPESDAPTVQGVELHLPEGFRFPAGFDPAVLPKLVAVRKGQPLSRRLVRRSLERLFATDQFADAIAQVEDVEGGVVVIFELRPKLSLTRVNVDGEGVLSEEEIRARSGLIENTEFYPEKLTAAVRAITEAHQRRGYHDAKVSADATELPAGVEVTLTVEPGQPTIIAALSVTGSPGLPLGRILSELGVTPGGVLDEAGIEAGLERLKAVYRQSRYYRARVGEPVVLRTPGEQRAAVAVPISAGPRFFFHFHGNRNVPDKLLLSLLGYDGAETLDPALMARLARRLENFYRYRGFYDVRITAHEQPSPTYDRAVLAFEIDEGPQLRVQEVVFSGNERVPTAQLRALLTDRIRVTAPEVDESVRSLDDPLEVEGRTEASTVTAPEPDPSTVFVESAYQEAAGAMEGVYRERGFLRAKVQLAQATLQLLPRTASIRFDITEGPQTLVEDVVFVGAPDEQAMAKAVTLERGAPLALSAVDASRAALYRVLGRSGYLFARVEADLRVSADGTRATVAFVVEQGPQVRVGQIILSGITRTEPALIREHLEIHEGDLLDPEAMFETQRGLVLLGTFRSVGIRLLNPDAVEAVKDVVIEVKERPRVEGDVAGGYFLIDGPRVLGTVAYTNVGGLGLNATARGKISYVGLSVQAYSGLVRPEDVQGFNGLGGRGNASISAPRGLGVLPDGVGLRLDFIGEREFRPAYRFTRFASVLGADWAAQRWLSLSLQYEIEHNRVATASRQVATLLTSVARSAEERLRFPIGIVSLHTLRPALTLDFRDDPANPSSGVLISTTWDLTRDLGATLTDPVGNPLSQLTVYTLKASGGITGYVPVAPRVVLALSARAGKFFLLDPNSATIAPKRFFLGGGSTLRGFREDGVLPADQREQLATERRSCAAMANRAGCTDAATVLLKGSEVPSFGGELFTLYKTELRFPLPLLASLDTGLFVEAGNLWLQQSRFSPLELRYVIGAGLRYVTPIGPLAFDLGYNVLRDVSANEPAVNVHFSIGLF